MGLFSKKDYNIELKNAVEDYINTSPNKRPFKVNKIKKYADKKLKTEKNFSPKQMLMLKDVTSIRRGYKITKYSDDELKLIHLFNDDFKNTIEHIEEEALEKDIETVTTKGTSVIFPKTNQKIVKNILNKYQQQITEEIVAGETGRLKVAEKGIVINTNEEILRIEWEKVKGLRGNILELGDGKHITFYKIFMREAVFQLIKERASYVDENGW